MKITNILALASFSLLMLTSCSSDEDLPQTDKGGEVRFSISVDNATRAINTADDISSFGVYMLNIGEAPALLYNNSKFTGSNTTDWTSPNVKWLSATQPVDIVAYAPYVEGQPVKFTIPCTNDYDIVACKLSGFVPLNDLQNDRAALTFNHLMAKVNITVNIINSAVNPITQTKLNGVTNQCDVDFTTLTVTPKGEADGVVLTPISNETARQTFSLLLPPQSLETLEVEFMVNGEIWKYSNLQPTTLAGGTVTDVTIQLDGNRLVKTSGFKMLPAEAAVITNSVNK